MILILSEENDMSTSHVIDWLIYFKQKFVRINNVQDLKIKYLDLDNDSFELEYQGKEIISKEIKGYWYRRGYLDTVNHEYSKNKKVNDLLVRFINSENKVPLAFVISLLENNLTSKISGFFAPNVNKLFQLHIAKKSGLKIPSSYIFTENRKIAGNYITKSMDNVFDFIDQKYSIINYTNKVESDDMRRIIAPSFVQECIDKKFEVRTFYLHGKTYSMGIFSQRNSKTKIDFRHYDDSLPNRNPPVKLPEELERKIGVFMKSLHLDCGSLDFVYSTSGEFIFLEVNPIGQFGMTSSPCNYHLEKLIAKTLTNEESI